MSDHTSMDPLRILFLLSQLKDSATYVRAYHLARNLARRGHDVTLMAVSRDSRFRSVVTNEGRLTVIETPNLLHNLFGDFTMRLFLEPGSGVLDIIARIRQLRRGKFHIIQTFDHSLNVAVPFYLLRNRIGAKFVSDWCDIFHFPGGLRYEYGFRLDRLYRVIGFLPRVYSKFVEFDYRRRVHGVIAISPTLRNFAVRHGVARERVFVVEGGADVDHIRPIPKAEARARLGLPAEGRIVGFLGTFQRDLDIVIRSFVEVRKRVPDSYLLVIGTPFPWTKEMAATHGITENFIEAGRCPEEQLPYYLASADVHVLPLKENLANMTRWPNKVGEYMASGRPIVVSDVGDVAKVVRRQRLGLVAETTPEDFADKIATILADDAMAAEMGQRAREAATGRYSWAMLAGELESIYRRLLQPGKPPRKREGV